METKNFDDLVIERLREDNELLDLYIKNSIQKFKETQDLNIFLFNLKCIVEAQGGMTSLSRKTKISRPGLYKMFEKKNFKLDYFLNVLHAIGLNLDIKPSNRYKYI